MAPILAVTLGQGIMWSDGPVAYNITLAAQQPNGGGGPPPSGNYIELESGAGHIALENGSGAILLE
jgi:hypothetical protein